MGRSKISDTEDQLVQRKNLGILVRMVRAAMGWSMRDLAQHLGWSHTSIAKLEIGTIRLSPSKISELMKLFDNCGVLYVNDVTGIHVSITPDIIHELHKSYGLAWPLNAPD